MSRLLKADARRMFRGKWFWLAFGGMLLMALGFIGMQYTAMDYTVPLSRVIFLPMSFYGVVAAALVSLFLGQDVNDGFIRNKIVAGRSRTGIYFSGMLISIWACLVVFVSTSVFTAFIGGFLFVADVGVGEILTHILLGIPMCVAYGCLFSVISMLCESRTAAVVVCMFLAFGMLFLCLHTNQILVQPQMKDGMLNPHYATGMKRVVYLWLHDINPFGQAAQLSSMNCFSPVRMILCDLIWGVVAAFGSCFFRKKEIK